MTTVKKLFDALDDLTYPKTMKKVKGEISGLAFFPGGKGTFDNIDNLTNKSIMIIGQDFDSEKNYTLSLKSGKEDINKNPTWRNLIALLEEVNVSPDLCFFTNAIMGIRKGHKGTGKSPAFNDTNFIKKCQDFFLLQLIVQKPEKILVLGKQAASVLSKTAKKLETWENIPNYKILDTNNNQIKKDVVFNNGFKSDLVILTHPSFRPQNIHRRTYKSFSGHLAEINMIKTLLK